MTSPRGEEQVHPDRDGARGSGPSLIGSSRQFGDPIEAQGHTVTPIIQLEQRGGRGGGGGAGRSGGGGIRIGARPLAVRVRGPDGREHELSLADPDRSALRAMLIAAVVIGVLGWMAARWLGESN